MKLKKTEIKAYYNTKDFNSSAINSIKLFDNNQVEIVFNNSDKQYVYDIISEEYVNSLTNCILSNESVGQFVIKSIKLGNIQQINTKVN